MADAATPTARRVAAPDLIRFIAAAYRAAGVAAPAAQGAAEPMAQSDISGADGHGVFRLPQYRPNRG
jgi:LDH2 family malate/lactate/ureidoglycolate dehydrogenase